jgi:hypothetical protein
MNRLSQQRTDITQSFEDYFQVIPPDINSFKIDKCLFWEYDDMENTVTFHFEDEWYLDEFLDSLEDCPKLRTSFDFEAFDTADRQNLTITIVGKIGGLLG